MVKVRNTFARKWLGVALVVLPAGLFSGCEAPRTTAVEGPRVAARPVFFPPPPEKPRLQFLKSFNDAEDLGAETTARKKKKSSFEDFILGEDKDQAARQQSEKRRIVKPYGAAIAGGKLYVCDVGSKLVNVLDLENRTFTYLTRDRRLINPVNICVAEGFKYVTDSVGGAIFVFDPNDTLAAILGRESKMRPLDIAVRDNRIYVTDGLNNQVVVLDRTSGKELMRIGKQGKESGSFGMINGLALDADGNIYVTDMLHARITELAPNGLFKRSFGKLSDNFQDFVRPKGISLDRQGRIWVVDAGTGVAKVYDSQGRLLMFFGLPLSQETRGTLKLPADVVIDYDHVHFFQKYAVPGAQIEFLVIVTSQFGWHKVSVFGFGTFPDSGGSPPVEPAASGPETGPRGLGRPGAPEPTGKRQ